LKRFLSFYSYILGREIGEKILFHLYLEFLFSNLNRKVHMLVPSDFYIYPTEMLKRSFLELGTEKSICGLKIF